MNETNSSFLYDFLPAVYRERDQEQVLQTLFRILQQELMNVQRQVDTAYANCFIETCEPWAEAYIGDLLGIAGLHDSSILPTWRARIANTIRYRRRKGQQGVLERTISDVTGWRASVVEFAQLLGTTQHLQHIRRAKGKTMNIRDLNGLATLGTPFEMNAHQVDVRNIPTYPAKFNINNLGLFLWRLVSYPITGAQPFAVTGNSLKRFTFNPAGLDQQLFNSYQTLTDLTETATESSLPVPIRSIAFQQDLSNYQQQYSTLPDSTLFPANSDYYGPQQSFCLLINNKPVSPNDIIAADLSAWSDASFVSPLSLKQIAAIDVSLGRFILADTVPAGNVTVNYHYGFSAPIGSGHYERQTTLNVTNANTIYVPIAPTGVTDPSVESTLEAAITRWQNNPSYSTIQIEDDATYTLNSQTISNLSSTPRSLTIQATNHSRPCLRISTSTTLGNKIQFYGVGALNVTLNGLLMDGGIDLQENIQLTVSHCTLIPRNTGAVVPSLTCTKSNSQSSVSIDNSITSAIYLPDDIINLTIRNSIIDANEGLALGRPNNPGPNKPGPSTTLEQVSVFGSIYVSELILLSNSIITQKVTTDRTQTGTVRFSYLTFDSETPARYQCQPDLDFIAAAQQYAEKLGEDIPYTQLKSDDPNWWNNTLKTLEPQFTSQLYNNPGYAQLDINSGQSILTGADNGSEMGCFQPLNQLRLQKQLYEILDEFLPLGLTAGLFYVT